MKESIAGTDMSITKKNNRKKIVIWGSGGISREIAWLIEDINNSDIQDKFEILGYIEKDESRKGEVVSGYKILGNYKILKNIDCDGYVLPIGSPHIKQKIYNEEIIKLNKSLIAFNLIHPSVIMRNDYIKFGVGNIICAGCILTTDISFGNFNLININCTIGHDTSLGDFNVINPITAISGEAKIGNNNLIGTGVKILQKLEIKDKIILGAGAVLTKNIYEEGTYVGIPAKKID